MSDSEATAQANPNIALIKYWGKKDQRLVLPMTGSLSLTLDTAPTTTTVSVDTSSSTTSSSADAVVLNGRELDGDQRRRVTDFIDLVRDAAGRSERVVVESVNEIPTGAGLASSASGFAALATAAAAAFGLDLDRRALSRLARRGSGSASRSIFGGLVVWHPGDDEQSFAEELPASGLELGMVMAVLVDGPKAVSSRAGMRRTVDTSPFYPAWLTSTPLELAEMRAAISRADFTAVGELAESNALRMHATMLGAIPPLRYWTSATVRLLDLVESLRSQGIECYATMDAGPNVKILTRASEVDLVADAVRAAEPAVELLRARAGHGARLVEAGAAAGRSRG